MHAGGSKEGRDGKEDQVKCDKTPISSHQSRRTLGLGVTVRFCVRCRTMQEFNRHLAGDCVEDVARHVQAVVNAR